MNQLDLQAAGVLIWLLIALGAGCVAANKGRSQWGGILLGLILGPLGLAIALLMREGPAL